MDTSTITDAQLYALEAHKLLVEKFEEHIAANGYADSSIATVPTPDCFNIQMVIDCMIEISTLFETTRRDDERYTISHIVHERRFLFMVTRQVVPIP